MTDVITPTQFRAVDGVEDWRVIGDGATAYFPTASFAESVRFALAIGEIPGLEDQRPDLDIRPDGVTVRVVTATAEHYGMSRQDAELARRISIAAREVGLSADPSRVQSVLVIPGASDVAAVMPFWRAVLAYEPRIDNPDEDLVDPRGRGPALWFERMERPRPDGGGTVHVAVWVPYEQAEARIAAALAAGGRMVRDQFAPAWWTLADAAGNEVDVATVKDRD